jgi:hypothetical protein
MNCVSFKARDHIRIGQHASRALLPFKRSVLTFGSRRLSRQAGV